MFHKRTEPETNDIFIQSVRLSGARSCTKIMPIRKFYKMYQICSIQIHFWNSQNVSEMANRSSRPCKALSVNEKAWGKTPFNRFYDLLLTVFFLRHIEVKKSREHPGTCVKIFAWSVSRLEAIMNQRLAR